MSCERIKAWIADTGRADLLAEPGRRIAGHLAECDACADMVSAAREMARAAEEWRDVPVPRMPPTHVPRRPLLTSWLPLAACLILSLLVLLRVEIRPTEAGWSVSFAGKSPDSAAITLDELSLMLEEERLRNTTELLGMIDARGADLRDELRLALAERAEHDRQSRAREWERFQVQLENRRIEDWDLFQTQILRLIERQDRQTRNLEQLAGFVSASRSDRY